MRQASGGRGRRARNGCSLAMGLKLYGTLPDRRRYIPGGVMLTTTSSIGRAVRGCALAAALIAAFSGSSRAQSVNGSIQGTVVDQSGAVLPGVTVTVTQTAT